MTCERAQAYGRVMKTLSDLAPTKFHPHQQEIIREAADTMFFCEDVAEDAGARQAMEAMQGLADHLLANDVLLRETVERLLADLEACGPLAPVV